MQVQAVTPALADVETRHSAVCDLIIFAGVSSLPETALPDLVPHEFKCCCDFVISIYVLLLLL